MYLASCSMQDHDSQIMFHAGFSAKIHVPCRISLQQICFRISIQKITFCARSPSRKTPFFKKHISENIFSQRISNLKRKKFGEWSSTEG
jgi:hypothetical protein